MKLSLILIGGWCAWMVHAQTNAIGPAPAAGATTHSSAPLPAPRAPTKIYSDSADFDIAARQAVYHGHVRVDDPQMKLTCARLTADVPESGGRVSRIVAETNVVIDFTDNKGQTNHATSDQAVYLYNVQNGVTNEIVTLTGNPQMENAQGTLTGDEIRWDRANNHVFATNQKMIFRQNLNVAAMRTNSPAAAGPAKVPPGTNAPMDKNASNPPSADF